jgi:hypothetical protein
MVRFLAASGADLSPVDTVGLTPYDRAKQHQNLQVMAVLRALGAPK